MSFYMELLFLERLAFHDQFGYSLNTCPAPNSDGTKRDVGLLSSQTIVY